MKKLSIIYFSILLRDAWYATTNATKINTEILAYIILFLLAFFLFVVIKIIPTKINSANMNMYKLELFDISKSIRNLSIKDNLLIHPPP